MAGEKISIAEYRELQGKPKPSVEGPAAPKGKALYALGRLPSGTMNKTEERFLHEYVEPWFAVREIVWWCFEGFKLRIAPATFIEIDFAIMRKDGSFELVDVKGSPAIIQDDAHVKMKVAASIFPFRFFYAWPRPKKEGGWHFEQVGRE